MSEYIGTKIWYSKNIDKSVYSELSKIARRLGILRTYLWHKYSSCPRKLNDRSIRDSWLLAKKSNKPYPKIIDEVPARLWKETLRDTIGDVNAYFEAGFTAVAKSLYKRYDKPKAKELCKLLRTGDYKNHGYCPEAKIVHRMVRRALAKGKSYSDNIICLDADCYSYADGRLNVMSLTKNRRLSFELTTNRKPSGNFKLVLRNGIVELHMPNRIASTNNVDKPYSELGVDKGYSEAFVDSEGNHLGLELGEVLTAKTEALNLKYRNRNKILAIYRKALAKGDLTKANRIFKNNLGKAKLNRYKAKAESKIKEIVYSGAKALCKSTKVLALEDLSHEFKAKNGARVNRILSSWMRSILDEAINKYSLIYDTKLVFVNAAYTSQGDHRYDSALTGRRNGDTFTGHDGVVLDADENAAKNIKARMYDDEITRYTSAKKVKEILLLRAKKVLAAHSVETARPVLQPRNTVKGLMPKPSAKSELAQGY